MKLDPVLLNAIGDLELVARVTVDGTVSGLHRSPFHGYSAEFSQYRHYRPGDDLKYVDWKLFARTDRLYTKQYRETTNLLAQIAVDASASMGYRGAGGVSKLEYGRLLAAALAHVIARQGDAVGLLVYDESLRHYIPSRSGQPHLRGVLVALSRMQPGSGTATAIALRRALDLLKRRGLLIVISDLYDEGEAVDRELRHAVRIGHEAAVFGRFWTMHLADLAAASPRPVELRFDRAVAAPGSLVTLTATLRETEFQNRERHVALPEVRGRIIGARGEEQRIRLWPTAVPGVFEAQWKAGTPGRYDVQVSTESGSTRDTIFMVDERAVLIPASDAEGLALVAASNGGVATTIEEIARLEEWLRALPRSHARIDVHPARSFWWTLAFVALLGAEWTLGRAGAWRARR